MKQKYAFFIAFLLAFLSFVPSYAKLYFGLGPEYVMPAGRLSDVNSQSLGLEMQLESRSFCNLWYGLRLDYISFEKKDTITIGNFKDAFYLSPEVRYIIYGCDCNLYTYQLMPYVQGMLTFSSIGGEDRMNRLGFGAALGAGLAYGFHISKSCWMVDLNAQYSSPNFIFKDVNRPSLNSINLSLTLSIGL